MAHGQSKRLTVNYRTTQEIPSLAVLMLGRTHATGLDDEAGTLTGTCRRCAGSSRPGMTRQSTRPFGMKVFEYPQTGMV